MTANWRAFCICDFEAAGPDYRRNESTMKDHQASCANWLAYLTKEGGS